MIVDDIGEVIGRHAVGLQQHLHVDLCPLDFDFSAQQIIDFANTLSRGTFIRTT